MSGGEYEYIYCKLEDFLEEYRSNIESSEDIRCPEEYYVFAEIVEALVPVLKSIEWEHSGDSYRFLEDFKEFVVKLESLNLEQFTNEN